MLHCSREQWRASPLFMVGPSPAQT
jgi:hypothetical protein